MSDLELKFGVQGGSSVSEGSGKEILNDLKTICSEISKTKQLKVKIQLDDTSKQTLVDQIRKSVKDMTSVRIQFGVDTAYLNKQLKNYFKNYVPPEPKKAPASSQNSRNRRKNNFGGQNNQNFAYNTVRKEQNKILKLRESMAVKDLGQGSRNAIQREIALREEILKKYKEQITDGTLLKRLEEEYAVAVAESAKKQTIAAEAADARLEKARKFESIYANASSYLAKFGDILKVNSPENYAVLEDFVSKLKNKSYERTAAEAAAFFKQFKGDVENAGYTVEGFGQKIRRVFGDKYVYGVIAFAALAARQLVAEVYKNVVEIDSAMTQLSIVTGKTGDGLADAFDRASTSAKNLGANITDLLGSMETFARLGYTMDQSQQLAEVATMMGKVADVSVDEATTGLTSIIKGFNIDPSQVEYVGDVLSNIGKKYAVSAAEIMEAFERSGAAFAATGTSFEKATALIAAGNAAVQDSAVVGTAMKSISARIRGATSELEELGEDYSDVANGVSKYREEIMALTNIDGKGGFDIMTDVEAGEYKDIYDIFVGLAETWNKLSGTSQARLAEILGGTRQLQVVSSIMQNVADATGAYNDALASSGTLSKDYEVYLDSINGRLGVLKASFQKLSASMLDSKTIKTFISGLTALTDGLTAISDKTGLEFFLMLIPTFKKLSKEIKVAKEASDAFSLSFGSIWGATGTISKIMLVVDALMLLNSVIKLIWGKDIAGWFNEWTKSAEEKIKDLTSSLRESNETMKQVGEEAVNFGKEYSDVVEKYLSLSEKVGPFEELDVSNSSYAEFLSLQNKIAEMFPSIDLGIDSNGNHILALSGDVDTLKNSFKELYQAKLEAFRTEQIENYEDSLSDYKKSQKIKENEINKLQDFLASLERVKAGLDEGKTQFLAQDAYALGQITDKISPSQSGYGVIVERAGDYAKAYEAAYTEAQAKINNFQKEIAAEQQRQSSIFTSLLFVDPNYQELDSRIKVVIDHIAASLNYEEIVSKVGSDSANSLTDYLVESIVLPLDNANIGEAIDKFLADEITFDEFRKQMQKAFSSFEGTDFFEFFLAYIQKTNPEVKTLGDAVSYVADEVGKLKEESDKNPLPFFGELSSVKTDFQVIEETLAKISSKGIESLGKEELSDLLRILPEVNVEIRSYMDALNKGASVEEEHAKLLNAMKEAAKGYINTRLADGFKDVAEAANKFGADSYQAQHAMRELAEVSPELISLLFDNTSGMYDLGDASKYTGNSIKELLQIQIEGKMASIKAEMASLSGQFIGTAKTALTAAAAMASFGSTGNDLSSHMGGIKGDYTPIPKADGNKLAELQAQYDKFEEALENLNKIDIPSGGGGGSSKTKAEELKDAYDLLNQSLKTHISLQEESFEKSKDLMDAEGMRTALIRQVGYYREMQRQAKISMDAIKEYYKSQGLSDQAAEQKKEFQDLSKSYAEATKSVEDAMDRMTKAIVDAFSEAVDTIQSVYDTLHSAADEYAATGYITVDTLQSIISQGIEYLALLQDENGQLVINEEQIKKVIAARTEQMTIESALAYVEALRTAKITENTEKLNQLLYATHDTTQATWGLVYATLSLVGLSSDEYEAALSVINSLRTISDMAIDSIGNSASKTKDALKELQTGVDSILKYVMDMIKDNINKQVEALEKQKDAFEDIIEAKKKSLELDKKELEYSEKVSDLTKKLSKIQNRIDSLELVGTRESEAERKKLLEEREALQKELAELQADNAIDVQKDSLDKMKEEYDKEKDDEIKKLKESISSKQKLYDEAIKYIETHWSTLKDELIKWNTEYGNALNEDIVKAWENALKAAEKYGSFTQALGGIKEDINNAGQGNNVVIGPSGDKDESFTDEDSIRAIVKTMKANSANWFAYTEEGRKNAAKENNELAQSLAQFGVKAVRGDDGVWYIDHVGGEKLYEKYASYHTGGIVGPKTIKDDEQFALLKNKEWVLSEKMVNNLTRGMKVIGRVQDIASRFFGTGNFNGFMPENNIAQRNDLLPNVSNNSDYRRISITIGDTTITGANQATIKEHERITRSWMNDFAKQLGLKW